MKRNIEGISAYHKNGKRSYENSLDQLLLFQVFVLFPEQEIKHASCTNEFLLETETCI
jgi:hypothetical protein